MNFTVSNKEIIVFLIAIGIVAILFILESNKTLKARIHIMIFLLYAIIVLLIANVYVMYPQYQINKNLQDSLQYESQP